MAVFTSCWKNEQKPAKITQTDNSSAHYHLGLACFKHGQIQLAKEQPTKVLKINPGSSGAEEGKKTVAAIKERR
ncbi:MAG: hypothetical protein JRF50_05210 [Deltaproteobacteria bacterium]|nr:hypothetical protein [Deltaproteobacteria bacterium]